jgi:hypothetical protein
MTVMLLALLFSDAAINTADLNENRVLEEQEIGGFAEPHVEARSRTHPWTPGVKSWENNSSDCPIFFQRDIKGFGVFRVGPRCNEDGLPHAL